MQIFLGYFVWGLILSLPLSWVVWRFRLLRFVPKFVLPERRARHAVQLPPQLIPLVLRGARQRGGKAGVR